MRPLTDQTFTCPARRRPITPAAAVVAPSSGSQSRFAQAGLKAQLRARLAEGLLRSGAGRRARQRRLEPEWLPGEQSHRRQG